MVIKKLKHLCLRLVLIWADSACAGQPLFNWRSFLRQRSKIVLEIVKRSDIAKKFVVLSKRWIIERPFGGWAASVD